jgi:hypothetical protein
VYDKPPYNDKFRDPNMNLHADLIREDRHRTSLEGFKWELNELRNYHDLRHTLTKKMELGDDASEVKKGTRRRKYQ